MAIEHHTSVATNVAPLHINELSLGKRIVSSCDNYFDAHEVKAMIRSSNNDIGATAIRMDGMDEAEIRARDALLRHVCQTGYGSNKYMIKFVKEERMQDHEGFEIAATRLANEDQILSQLSHPNICSIFGRAAEGTEAYYLSGRNDSYFLIMEQMKETLFDKTRTWRRQRDGAGVVSRRFGTGRGSRSSRASKSRALLMERIKVAIDLSSALSYIHSKGIVHRNIHPGNVGFDDRGNVQLFGFGHAKKLENSSSAFSLYGDDPNDCCGGADNAISPDLVPSRYTANEVLYGEQHGTAADVFSFTTLLFELLTLPESLKKLRKRCSLDNASSSTDVNKDDGIPMELQQLIEQGWKRNPLQRPSMKTYEKILRQTYADMEADEKFYIRRSPNVRSKSDPSVTTTTNNTTTTTPTAANNDNKFRIGRRRPRSKSMGF